MDGVRTRTVIEGPTASHDNRRMAVDETESQVDVRVDASGVEEKSMSDDSAGPPACDWRSRTSYAYTEHLTRDAWAWEFLRRNPKYRAAWKRITEPNRSSNTAASIASLASVAATWGLLFPF